MFNPEVLIIINEEIPYTAKKWAKKGIFMDLSDFRKKIQWVKKTGYIQSHRKGPTGIGKTLEDLLGITENNIAGPDFSVYELKTGRKDSGSMLTHITSQK